MTYIYVLIQELYTYIHIYVYLCVCMYMCVCLHMIEFVNIFKHITTNQTALVQQGFY